MNMEDFLTHLYESGGFWTHLYVLWLPTCKSAGSWSTNWSFWMYLEADVLGARRKAGFTPPFTYGPMFVSDGSRFSKGLRFECGIPWGLLETEFLSFSIPILLDGKC